ncbi:TonB-dependent receptor domain-containing protein [Mucilaginibacter terrae]|uniref:Outer membrane receptor protein involved in Fe transport n=1 Tax=Mucilaginibacter terrae TaxID=1955052 RepID=A0ABU3GSY9_9SPHI|nr:TonB-dependent receptor [Mucilaginibacter terrae]MDT3402900.1 outer membrane receptor protein involved in Fe transport [Mucilaginibacter terrae]
MNFRVIQHTLLILLTFFTINAAAQTGGTVTGKLVDGNTGQPLDFASVSVTNKADNTTKGIQTDLNGNFKIDGLKDGAYTFKATFLGYLTLTQEGIQISPSNKTVQLGLVKIKPAKGVLKEVVVTGQRSQIKLSTDKKVFSVDQSLVSQGGSATDLLTNVPSVQVDVEGNVALRGSNNVRVLVNGKPSAISGGSVADILQSIPASAIENIEVITNPSSKYDAEGQSGIINIILKRNAQIGFNGSVAGTVGNQKTQNASLNLAYQTSKVNLFGNYSYRKANRIGNGYTNRTTYPGTANAIFQNQESDQTFKFNSHNIRTGIDINLDPKTVLTLSDNINIRDRDRFQNGGTGITTKNALTQRLTQNNFSGNSGNNIDLNADFSHKYKQQGQELTANVGYSTQKEDGDENLYTLYNFYSSARADSAFKQNNYTTGRQRNLNFQADYTMPLGKESKLEAGYRSTFNRNDNDYRAFALVNKTQDQFLFDPTRSNHLIYNEQVHAIYTNYQRQFGKFGVQAGVRLEDAHIRSRLVGTTDEFKQDYFRVYPSIFLSDKLTENQTLQLSYTRRVSRPRDRQINPFLDRSDPLNYQQGNPNLRPEDTHAFELSYMNYWNALTLTSSVYYRYTNQNIQQVRLPLDSVRTITRFDNINSAANAGYELIAKLTASSKLDLTGNVNVYYRNIKGDPALFVQSTSGYAFNGNLTANIKPVKKLGIQVRGDYQGKQVIAQGYSKAMYGLDGGVRYDITKALNISGNVRDVFNTRKFGSIINNTSVTIPYTSESYRRFSFRTISFTLSYRFGGGGTEQKKKKNQDQDNGGGSPDDMGGGGMGGGPLRSN